MRKTLRYASSFVAYVFITLADGKFTPFSLSLLFANVYIGLNPLGSFALYVLPFAASLDITVVWTSALGGLIVAVSATFLRRKKSRGYAALCALSVAVAVVPFAAFARSYDVVLRSVYAGITVASVFPMTAAVRVWLIKGLKYRVSTDEFISAAVLLCAVGYGAVSVTGEYPWFAVSTLCVMLSASLLPGFTPLLFGVVLSVPPSKASNILKT